MRPVLKPGLRRVWRNPSTLQIGLDPERAIVLTGVDAPARALLASLDGTRDRDGVLQVARRVGLDQDTAQRLLDTLDAGGALDDAARDTRVMRDLPRPERDRLGPDLLSLSLLQPEAGAALATLERRRARAVEVRGCGRVGATLACVLASSGIGHVAVRDPHAAGHADRAPAGTDAADVGASRAEAVRRAMARIAPTVRTDAAHDPRPHLVVLAPDGPAVAPDDDLVRRGVPHLVARVRETTGVVGPLVLPGETSCLRCADLHRRDRDPSWPQVATQLLTPHRPYACDTGLATLVGTVAALQALAHLDGGRPVDAADGTLEYALADLRQRRRSWPAHPACGCRWPARSRATPSLDRGDFVAPASPEPPRTVTMGA